MAWLKWALAALAALTIPASAQSPTQLQPTQSNKAVLSASKVPATSAPAAAARELAKADVDAWLDGFMPYALKAGGIPGASALLPLLNGSTPESVGSYLEGIWACDSCGRP